MKSIKKEFREIALLNDELGKNLGIKKIVVRQIQWYETIQVNDADEQCVHQLEWDDEEGDYYCEACQNFQGVLEDERRWDECVAERNVGVAQ